MAFIIRNTQNRDSLALHAKLDELIINTETARNRVVLAGELPNSELRPIRDEARDFARASRKTKPLGRRPSLEASITGGSGRAVLCCDRAIRRPPATDLHERRSKDMCISCGCKEPDRDHGDTRNITTSSVKQAADAAGISVSDVMINLAASSEKVATATQAATP